MSTAVPKQKSRLGRGLSSLLSISELPVEADVTTPRDIAPAAGGGEEQASVVPATSAVRPTGAAIEIPLDQIIPNPHQPRRQIEEASIAELAASIKSTGLIQPVIVRRSPSSANGDADQYELIAGERRWRAAKLAGLATLPVIIRDVDSFTQAQMALIENIQREDLNAIDRAESYRTLMTQLGLTQAELAGRLGEDRSSIANFLRLLDLSDTVRQLVRDRKLTLGHAKVLAGVDDPMEQERLANLVLAQELSVRNLERLLESGTSPAPARQTSEPSAHIKDLEQSIARQLGMRVQVRSGTKGKGKVTIHYASLDQFDELMSKLGVSMSEE
jgi:ParB family chromosome partitioning protein